MRNPRHCVNYSLCRGEVVKQSFCPSCKELIRLLGQIHADDGRRPLGEDGQDGKRIVRRLRGGRSCTGGGRRCWNQF